jgi:ribonuclease VapC
VGPVEVFVDTSVIVAIILDERDAPALADTLDAAERRLTSPAVRLETCMVLTSRLDLSPLAAQDLFDDFLLQSEVAEFSIDERVGRLAVECFERYGKGRHRAGLNFGDCLSYACAKAHGAALLFKGEDFAQTDAATP